MSHHLYAGMAAIAAAAIAASPRAAAAPRIACPSIENVDSVLARGTVTLFGEMHGTQQSPAFVGGVVCNAAARRIPATLALELPTEATPVLERYVHSNGTQADRDSLLANELWREPFRDGRSSVAMLALLDSVRVLVRQGADVSVLAFSWPSALGDQRRDSLMARTLADAATMHPQRVIVGLTGNLHSRSARRTLPNTTPPVTYSLMTYALKAMLPDRRVLGLNVSYDTGTAWICTSALPTSCGAHAINGHMSVPVNSIRLGSAAQAYDGLYGVGPISASPPAVP